jgi:hypothetical protein
MAWLLVPWAWRIMKKKNAPIRMTGSTGIRRLRHCPSRSRQPLHRPPDRTARRVARRAHFLVHVDVLGRDGGLGGGFPLEGHRERGPNLGHRGDLALWAWVKSALRTPGSLVSIRYVHSRPWRTSQR